MLNNRIVTELILFSFAISYFFLFPPPIPAQTESLTNLSLQKCLESGMIEDQLDNLFASDNESIFVTILHQKLLSIDRRKLTLNWKSDFGGQISNFLIFQNELYLTTENNPGKTDQIIIPSYTENTVSLQSNVWMVNKSTGLPVRKVRVRVEHIISLLGVGENLVLIGSGGEIYFFNSALQVLREIKAGNTVEPIGTAIILQGKVLAVSGVNIWSYDPKVNRIEQLLKSKEDISVLAANEKGDFVYGDKKGNVIYYNSLKKKINWKYRTGARILGITDSKNGMVINSADNFVYLITDQGALKWKKRFKDSPDQIISRENFLYLILNRDHLVSVINSDTGKDILTIEVPVAEGSSLSLYQLKSLSDSPSSSFALKEANKISIYNTTGHCP